VTPLVVLDLATPADETAADVRLDVFPGSATPAVFPAASSFWIGYGFAPDPGAPSGETLDEGASRFELEVDGEPVESRSELTYDGAALLRKTVRVDFPDGLPVGWHELSARWYDGGKLLLASKAAIEFVEP